MGTKYHPAGLERVAHKFRITWPWQPQNHCKSGITWRNCISPADSWCKERHCWWVSSLVRHRIKTCTERTTNLLWVVIFWRDFWVFVQNNRPEMLANHESRVTFFLETHTKPQIPNMRAQIPSEQGISMKTNEVEQLQTQWIQNSMCLIVRPKTTAMPPCSLPLPVHLQPLQRKHRSLCFWRWVRVFTWRITYVSQPFAACSSTHSHTKVSKVLGGCHWFPHIFPSKHINTYHTYHDFMTCHDISWPNNIWSVKARPSDASRAVLLCSSAHAMDVGWDVGWGQAGSLQPRSASDVNETYTHQ